MNNPNTTPENMEQKNKGLSLKFFRELVEKQSLADKIKKDLGDWGEEYEAPLPEVLKKKDKDKLKDYEELKVQNLPKDWEFKLARIQELEKKTFDYNQQKEELKTWTDAFNQQKPLEVQDQIKQLEEDKKAIEEELNDKIKVLEEKLTTAEQEKQTILINSQQKEQELMEKLNKWTQIFGDKDFGEVKAEWEDLQQRPDITISEEEFLNDYARRPTLEVSKLEREELTKTQKQMLEWKEKGQRLWWAVGKFKENERKRKYALSPSILTIKQAREAIAELLAGAEKDLEEYLKSSDNVEVKNFTLDLSLEHRLYSKEQSKKEISVQQILEWIKEARATLDYETLFERWSGSKEYNKESELRDYDGSLYLLSEYLKFKEFEVNSAEQIPQQIIS